MPIGRSIRIYLDGGEVSGIRHAELVNWTGQALLCPRSRLAELVTWEKETRRPGVYFLFEAEDVTSRKVYVGESESVLERLKQHVGDESWQEALLFTSKDENLTKAHVKFLESRLIERARTAGRYSVTNTNQPALPGLPRADRDAMEEFLLHLPILLGVLGHRVLDPLTGLGPDKEEGPARIELSYAVREASARGAVTDDGFVVFKGSTALKQLEANLPLGWRAIKEQLVKTSKLVDAGAVYKFVEDTLFNSPSAAAAVVYGNNVNGRVAWKTADGKPLKQLEEEQAAEA